jgi:PAS domain S-box-containing protein
MVKPSEANNLADTHQSREADRRRIAELEALLGEAQQTLDAIRDGEVDAVVVGGPETRRIYTLESADRSYRMLIEQMAEGAIMLSADSVVLYANQALSDLLGLPPGHVLGRSFVGFVADGDRSAFNGLLLHGGTGELTLCRPGRGDFPARLSFGELATDAGPVMCGVVTNLTDSYAHAREMSEARSRLAVEGARREIDERYRLILESATDLAVVSTDVEGRVQIWNTGATKILGWEPAEVVGSPMPVIWTLEDCLAGVPDRQIELARELGRADTEGWRLRKDGSRFWSNSLIMPLRGEDGAVIGFLKILRDRTDQRRAAEQQETLINELNHRVKNTLATVQSIASQTLRTAATPEDARAALDERLVALSRAHNVLTKCRWESAQLEQIVAEAMAPYRDPIEDRISAQGPDVRFAPPIALAISMALHELATNAVKYGALSCAGGNVSVIWTLGVEANRRVMQLVWAERGGPRVDPPRREGFGTRLLRRSLAAELGGKVTVEFAPTGVVCVLEAVISEWAVEPIGAAVAATPMRSAADCRAEATRLELEADAAVHPGAKSKLQELAGRWRLMEVESVYLETIFDHL